MLKLCGFGSYFSKETYNDIDLVGVLERSSSSDIEAIRKVKRLILEVVGPQGVPVRTLLFNEEEFAEQPLRDMHTLTVIYFIG